MRFCEDKENNYGKKKTLREAFPEIAAQWHPTKNGSLTPDQVMPGSKKKVWWRLPYDAPATGKHFDFEWEATIYNRTVCKTECPFLSNKAVWPGYNDLATRYPEIAAQWHLTKNGSLTPAQVTPGSNKKVWWFLPYDDPATGKHFDFEWEAKIVSRTFNGRGCPYLSSQAVWPGYNDLATRHPEIAAQWHPTKNGTLTPDQVVSRSNKKAWWYLPYDDPATGKHFDFEWEATIHNRTVGKTECPYPVNQAAWPGYNDLATRYPEIAAQWHPTRNGNLTPDQVTPGSDIKVWWYLPYDDPITGKHFDFEWEARIRSRTIQKYGCPYLSNQVLWPGYNDLATRYPEIAAQWHPTKNRDLTPDQVTLGSATKVWWLQPYDDPVTGKHFDFEWEAKIVNRTNLGEGCPYLSNTAPAVWPGYNDLATRYPEIAAQWHPTKNKGLTPDKALAGGHKWRWWFLPYDDPVTGKHYDFEWIAPVEWRIKNPSCPFLINMGVWPGYNDLQTCFPEIALQWNYKKNRKMPDSVMKYSRKSFWWKCDQGHEWKTPVYYRTKSGTGCPVCEKIRRRYGIWTD